MSDINTKQSGKSPGTGKDTTSMVATAKEVLSEGIASGSAGGKIEIEMLVGKGYRIPVGIPLKLFIYQKHTDASLDTFFSAFHDDADKIFAQKGSTGGTNAPGVADSPDVGDNGIANTIFRPVKILLPVRYPITEVGGDMGVVDGTGVKRKGRKTILARIPSVVPLLSVCNFLFHLNNATPVLDRKIAKIQGSGRKTYLVPQTAADNTRYVNGLAAMVEQS